MQLQIKLMGVLRERQPAEPIDWPAGTTLQDVFDRLGIEPGEVQVCSVNGALVRDRAHRLADGDELQILPPVGGG